MVITCKLLDKRIALIQKVGNQNNVFNVHKWIKEALNKLCYLCFKINMGDKDCLIIKVKLILNIKTFHSLLQRIQDEIRMPHKPLKNINEP